MKLGTFREPAVAGSFYPCHSGPLKQQVEGFIESARPSQPARMPRAIIAPHAGYIYSGAIAGSAYRSLLQGDSSTQRVVLLGPSHYCSFAGLALSHHAVFRTPLGDVPVDTASIDRLQALPQVQFLEAAHALEHCLETQLPFLQCTLGDVSIIPVVVGSASPETVAEVLGQVWDAHTLVVVSSDLSHDLKDADARIRDEQTCRKIERLDHVHLAPEEACGARAIAGLLKQAMRCQLSVNTLDLRNSGDTAGGKDRVVGYGAWRFD